MTSVQLSDISANVPPWEVAKIKVAMEAYFKQPHYVGFYNVYFETDMHHLAFLVEVPEKGHPFVFEVMMAKRSKWGKKRFVEEVEKYSANAQSLPSRILARKRHDENAKIQNSN